MGEIRSDPEVAITPNPPKLRLKRALLAGLEELPVLPTILAEVSGLDPLHEDYFDRLIALAEHDQLFAARVIHMANSAAYQGRGPVLSVRVAITRMGSRVVREILVAMAVMRVFVPDTPAAHAQWLHALQVALASVRLARDAGASIDPGTMYLGALLHDVGRFVMLDVAPEELGNVDEASFSTPTEVVRFERNLAGIDHATLGAKAAAAWGLPRWVCRFIESHHLPEKRIPRDLREPLDVLATADLLATALAGLEEEDPTAETLDALAERVATDCPLDLPADRITPHVRPVFDESRAILAALGI